MDGAKKEPAFDASLEKFTIVLLGAPAVGKSALTLRMVTDNFVKDNDPTIEDIYTKRITVDGRECVLSMRGTCVIIAGIVDTAGNDDFSVLVDGWIGEGDGFLLVFSITDLKGYNMLNTKRARILKVKEKSAPPMLLIGNKCDMATQRMVKQTEAKAQGDSWKIEYMETSAKVNEAR